MTLTTDRSKRRWGRLRILLPLALLMVLALGLAACGADGDAGAEGEGGQEGDGGEGGGEATQTETLRVGIVGPLTGGGADLGTRTIQGAELALQMANDDGGITAGDTTYEFEAVVADNETDVGEGVSQIRRLVQVEEVDAIVGGTLSDITLAMMEIAEDLQTPMIIPGAISPDIPRTIAEDDYRYVFMSSPTAVDRASADAEAIHSIMEPQRIFTVSQETAWGLPMQESFTEKMNELNADVEFSHEPVPPGHTDYGGVIGNIRDFEPDLVYASLVGAEMFSFMEQLSGRGVDTHVFGASSDPASSVFVEELGDIANGVFANMVWVPDSELGDPELIERFSSEYEEAHGHIPADVEAQAFDATRALLAGIEQAGSAEKEAVADALLDVEIVGVRGPQHFQEEDHSTRDLPYVIAQIQDGEHVLLWPDELSEGEPQLE